MSATVMQPSYANRRENASPTTNCGVDNYVANRHLSYVFNTKELLSHLEAVNARNVDMARVLGLPDSRIAEIRKGRRALKLDEAAKLVAHYRLDETKISPLSLPVARLVVLHLARSLGADISDRQVGELASDVRAFSSFLADPRVRESVESAESFLQGLQLGKQAQA